MAIRTRRALLGVMVCLATTKVAWSQITYEKAFERSKVLADYDRDADGELNAAELRAAVQRSDQQREALRQMIVSPTTPLGSYGPGIGLHPSQEETLRYAGRWLATLESLPVLSSPGIASDPRLTRELTPWELAGGYNPYRIKPDATPPPSPSTATSSSLPGLTPGASIFGIHNPGIHNFGPHSAGTFRGPVPSAPVLGNPWLAPAGVVGTTAGLTVVGVPTAGVTTVGVPSGATAPGFHNGFATPPAGPIGTILKPVGAAPQPPQAVHRGLAPLPQTPVLGPRRVVPPTTSRSGTVVRPGTAIPGRGGGANAVPQPAVRP